MASGGAYRGRMVPGSSVNGFASRERFAEVDRETTNLGVPNLQIENPTREGGLDAPASVSVTPDPARPPVISALDFEAFIAGYRLGNGREEWLLPFIRTLRCEGSQWVGYHGQNNYWTRAQFSLDTWAKVVRHFPDIDPDSPYWVGLAVAWWSSLTNPAEQWGCWPR